MISSKIETTSNFAILLAAGTRAEVSFDRVTYNSTATLFSTTRAVASAPGPIFATININDSEINTTASLFTVNYTVGGLEESTYDLSVTGNFIPAAERPIGLRRKLRADMLAPSW